MWDVIHSARFFPPARPPFPHPPRPLSPTGHVRCCRGEPPLGRRVAHRDAGLLHPPIFPPLPAPLFCRARVPPPPASHGPPPYPSLHQLLPRTPRPPPARSLWRWRFCRPRFPILRRYARLVRAVRAFAGHGRPGGGGSVRVCVFARGGRVCCSSSVARVIIFFFVRSVFFLFCVFSPLFCVWSCSSSAAAAAGPLAPPLPLFVCVCVWVGRVLGAPAAAPLWVALPRAS